MTKIMLVEDDKSLREIYGVRLLAEGFDIVSAGDGEEALAMAIKERPALIITDVMMPRISGFDMLDILRSTTETKDIKVIMMTALSSEDQRRHGEQLGADRYLVKSQVGIEDVVRVVHEVLGNAPSNPVPPDAVPASNPAAPPAVPAAPAQTSPATTATVTSMQPPAIPAQPAVARMPVMPPVSSTVPSAPANKQRVIQPLNDPTAKVDINSLLSKEMARQASGAAAQAASLQDEKTAMASQLQVSVPPVPAPSPSTSTPIFSDVTPPAAPAAPVSAPVDTNPMPGQPGVMPPAQPVSQTTTVPVSTQPSPRPPLQAQPRTIPVTTPVPPRPSDTPPAPTV